MKVPRKVLIMLLLSGLSVLSLSCTAKSDAAVPANQIVTVTRGNLTVDITAAGNLALSRTEDLAFDIFYAKAAAKATVGEVLVKEGDSVTEGQVLAKLDTSEWDKQLTALEDAVTTAERQLTTKKRALLQVQVNQIDAETALRDTEAQYVWPAEIYAAQAAVRSAESAVEEAQAVLRGDKLIYDRNTNQYRYQELLTAWDIKVWNDKLATAEATLGAARLKLDKLLAQSDANVKVKNAEARLTTAQAKLANLIAEYTPDTSDAKKIERQKKIEIQKTEVELAQVQLTDAQNGLEGVTKKRLQVEQAKGNVEDAQQAIKDAEKALADAQEDLDDAKSKSPIITAPFAGFITKVNVKGGDEVLSGAVAVQLADPSKFEADIMVSEMDILSVKLGGAAQVQATTMPGVSFSANVTQIAPTATIQSGVVNYKVKVEVQPLEAITPARSPASDNLSSANITSPRQRTGGNPFAGNTTSPRQRTGGNPFAGNTTSPRQPTGDNSSGTISPRPGGMRAGQQQMPTMATENFQLREGLTVTVSIITQERYDVLLVPNGAITRRRMSSTVKVSKDGIIEERAITTGISNWQYTEVISGLSEGEPVVVPKSATTTTTTSQQRPPGGFIPGMGRMIR